MATETQKSRSSNERFPRFQVECVSFKVFVEVGQHLERIIAVRNLCNLQPSIQQRPKTPVLGKKLINSQSKLYQGSRGNPEHPRLIPNKFNQARMTT